MSDQEEGAEGPQEEGPQEEGPQEESPEGPDQEIAVRLGRIFEESLNMPPPAPEEDIIEAGVLDSLALVTLLFEIEREFGLEIPLESLEIDDFRSLAGIAQLLTKVASTR